MNFPNPLSGNDKGQKRTRCFIINEANKDKVHKSVRDNVKSGDQYCEILNPEMTNVLAASAGSIDMSNGIYSESAMFGTEQDIALARKHTLEKLKSIKPSGTYR